MKITYWSDYACPYCYIGEKRLETALEKLGLTDKVEIEMKSFELDPGASLEYTGTTVDRFAKKYVLSKEGAAAQIDHISQLGKDEGIDFRYADTRYTNTLDAHRLTKLVQSKGDAAMTNRVIQALFDAYFTKNLELSSRDVLLSIGVEAGLAEDEITSMLDSNVYTDEVRLDEREAYRYDVHAVPFFVVGSKYALSGAQPEELFEQALTKALAESDKLISMQGMSCGIDGCR